MIIIRCEGPKGGLRMPKMLTPTSAIMGTGLGCDVALMTDGRFRVVAHGFVFWGDSVPDEEHLTVMSVGLA